MEGSGGGGGTEITVDEQVTSTSTNPVQSKGIYDFVNNEVDPLKSDLDKIVKIETSPNLINPNNWKNGYRCVYGDTMSEGSVKDNCKYYYLGKFNEGDTLVFAGMIASDVRAISYGDTVCRGIYSHVASDLYETSLDGKSMYTYTVTEKTHIGVYIGINEGMGYVALKSEYDKTHTCLAFGCENVEFAESFTDKVKNGKYCQSCGYIG